MNIVMGRWSEGWTELYRIPVRTFCSRTLAREEQIELLKILAFEALSTRCLPVVYKVESFRDPRDMDGDGVMVIVSGSPSDEELIVEILAGTFCPP